MKPREERQKVMVKARMRSDAPWNDVCIVNLSLHGLGIQTSEPPSRGISFVHVQKENFGIEEDARRGRILECRQRKLREVGGDEYFSEKDHVDCTPWALFFKICAKGKGRRERGGLLKNRGILQYGQIFPAEVPNCGNPARGVS